MNIMVNRRTPITTAASAARTMGLVLANAPIEPPPEVQLRHEQDRAFWRMIIRARSRDEWGLHDLVLAGQLARVMADIESEQKALDQESYVLQTDKGWPHGNPRAVGINTLSQRQLRLMTALRITGAIIGEVETLIPQRKAEREAEKTIKRLSEAGSGGEPPLLTL